MKRKITTTVKCKLCEQKMKKSAFISIPVGRKRIYLCGDCALGVIITNLRSDGKSMDHCSHCGGEIERQGRRLVVIGLKGQQVEAIVPFGGPVCMHDFVTSASQAVESLKSEIMGKLNIGNAPKPEPGKAN